MSYCVGNALKNRSIELDFDGGSHLYRNAELGMDVPVDVSPSGISAARRKSLAAALRREGFDVATGGHTIHIGRASAFDRFGRFAGLAEGIGAGDAYVMLDDTASDAELLNVIRHEAGHLLGTLDHGGAGLARYAFTHTLYSAPPGGAIRTGEAEETASQEFRQKGPLNPRRVGGRFSSAKGRL